jgi:hypothetical protein
MTEKPRKPTPRHFFTIVELDDWGVPFGEAVVHTASTDMSSGLTECVFRKPDTDEYYRFYYHHTPDCDWYEDFPDGTVKCTRVIRVPTLVQQWRGVEQRSDNILVWAGNVASRDTSGTLIPLLDSHRLDAGHILLTDDEADHLIRLLGGTPQTRKAAAPTLLRSGGAAHALGMSQSTLTMYAHQGKVPSQRDPNNGYFLFDVDAVRVALEDMRTKWEQDRLDKEQA